MSNYVKSQPGTVQTHQGLNARVDVHVVRGALVAPHQQLAAAAVRLMQAQQHILEHTCWHTKKRTPSNHTLCLARLPAVRCKQAARHCKHFCFACANRRQGSRPGTPAGTLQKRKGKKKENYVGSKTIPYIN